MGKLWSIGLAVLMAACGGDDEPTMKDRLIGSWTTFLDVGVGLSALSYTFEADDRYEINTAYAESNHGIQMQVVAGDYDLRDPKTALSDDEGTYLFLDPKVASCAGGITRLGLQVSFRGEALRLTDETGLLVLEPVRDSEDGADGDGASFTFGCFTADGFVPFPIQEL